MHNSTTLQATAVAALLLALAGPDAMAQAATAPDAGALRQQIEQNRQPTLPQARRPDAPPAPEMKPAGALSVTVTRFEFRGNRLLDTNTLNGVVAPWLNRTLDFADLQRAVAAVGDAYRAQGWVARAYLPQQEVTAGSVTVQLVEAVLGRVLIDAAKDVRYPTGQALGVVQAAQSTGQPIKVTAIDRALLILEDTPGLRAKANLAPGKAEGETDLLLQLESRPLLRVDVGLDNTGSRSTGPWRLTASAQAQSYFGVGDLGSASLIHTEGSDYLRAAFSMPVQLRGARAGMSASTMDYRVVSSAFSSLGLKGSSQTLGLDGSYPVLRSTARNLHANATLDFKSYVNKSAGVTTSDYKVWVATAGVTGSNFDEWAGGGLTSAGLTFSTGRVNLGGSPNQASDAATTRTHGGFAKLRYSVSRQQVINRLASVTASVTGQLASKNLESGEKFYLGGAYGVRAYPSSEAGGSAGLMLNVEARYRFQPSWVASGFYDLGQVTVNRDNSFTGSAPKNTLSLRGLGASVGWQAPVGVNLQLTWAHRLGNNPNPSASGQDQDGTLVKNRFWFTAGYHF